MAGGINHKKTISEVVFLISLITVTFVSAGAQYQDQNKLYRDPVEGYLLYYSDDNTNDFHDPGEAYFASPGAYPWGRDNSCWMAAASNLIVHGGNTNDYLTWIGEGLVPSPIPNPWGDIFSVGGGGSHFTFDDGGYSNWIFEQLDISLYGPIITTTEFAIGGWTIDPIEWCQAKLNSGMPVVIDLWWGDAKRGWLPSGFFNAPEGYYHAITVWHIDEASQTMTITDSDDGIEGPREVTYTFVGNDWVIDELYSGWPGRINYAAGINLPVSAVPSLSDWGVLALITIITICGIYIIRNRLIMA